MAYYRSLRFLCRLNRRDGCMAQRDNGDSWPNYPLDNNGSGYPSVPARGVPGSQQSPMPPQPAGGQGSPSAQGRGYSPASNGYGQSSAPYQQPRQQVQASGYPAGYQNGGYTAAGAYQQPMRSQVAPQGTGGVGYPSPYGTTQGLDAYGRPYPTAGQQAYPGQPGAAPSLGSQPQASRPQAPLVPSQDVARQTAYQHTTPSQGIPNAQERGPVAPHGHFAQRPSPYDGKRGVASAQRSIPVSDRESQKGGRGRTVIFACLGLLVGVAIGIGGMFLLQGGPHSVPAPVAGVLNESQLSTVVGSYRYKGEVFEITARDAILGSGSLSSARRSDGTYETPSTDDIVSYARNSILAQLVRDNGIEVSADEVAQYALNLVGSSDADVVAAYFGMDGTDAQRLLGEAAAVAKLRQSVVEQRGSAPEPPQPPADGATEVGSQAYADYIIGLLGSNWDSSAQTWANTANPYYDALKDEVFAPGSASYDSAQLAYSIAREEYEKTPSAQQQWAEYLNTYLDEGSIAVGTLRA